MTENVGLIHDAKEAFAALLGHIPKAKKALAFNDACYVERGLNVMACLLRQIRETYNDPHAPKDDLLPHILAIDALLAE